MFPFHSLLTPHSSIVSSHYSLYVSHFSFLTLHDSLFTTHSLLFSWLTCHCSLFAIHFSQFTSHCLTLLTSYSTFYTTSLLSHLTYHSCHFFLTTTTYYSHRIPHSFTPQLLSSHSLFFAHYSEINAHSYYSLLTPPCPLLATLLRSESLFCIPHKSIFTIHCLPRTNHSSVLSLQTSHISLCSFLIPHFFTGYSS